MMIPTRTSPKRTGVLWISVFALTSLSVSAALACSTVAFRQPGGVLAGYNFDFEPTDAGFLLVNPTGAARASIMDENGAPWTVRFGSVTLNQVGLGMPAAGMNTAGLVVTLMWNEDAVFGGGDGAALVSELEFIQRLLDTSGTVEEALASIEDLRIEGFVPIHYFLVDGSGAMASVLPTGDGFVVHTGDEMPFPALTNTSYDVLMEDSEQFEGFGGDRPIPSGTPEGASSLERFVIATAASRHEEAPTTPGQVFGVLNDMADPSTRWQVVFDPNGQQIVLRTAEQKEERVLTLRDLDFGCAERPPSADLTNLPTGDLAAALTPLEPTAMAESMGRVFSSLKGTADFARPEVVAGLSAGLFASLTCRR